MTLSPAQLECILNKQFPIGLDSADSHNMLQFSQIKKCASTSLQKVNDVDQNSTQRPQATLTDSKLTEFTKMGREDKFPDKNPYPLTSFILNELYVRNLVERETQKKSKVVAVPTTQTITEKIDTHKVKNEPSSPQVIAKKEANQLERESCKSHDKTSGREKDNDNIAALIVKNTRNKKKQFLSKRKQSERKREKLKEKSSFFTSLASLFNWVFDDTDLDIDEPTKLPVEETPFKDEKKISKHRDEEVKSEKKNKRDSFISTSSTKVAGIDIDPRDVLEDTRSPLERVQQLEEELKKIKLQNVELIKLLEFNSNLNINEIIFEKIEELEISKREEKERTEKRLESIQAVLRNMEMFLSNLNLPNFNHYPYKNKNKHSNKNGKRIHRISDADLQLLAELDPTWEGQHHLSPCKNPNEEKLPKKEKEKENQALELIQHQNGNINGLENKIRLMQYDDGNNNILVNIHPDFNENQPRKDRTVSKTGLNLNVQVVI